MNTRDARGAPLSPFLLPDTGQFTTPFHIGKHSLESRHLLRDVKSSSCVDSMVLRIVELYEKKVISQTFVGDGLGEGQGVFTHSVAGQCWTS